MAEEYSLSFSREALADLIAIIEYIANDNPVRAQSLLAKYKSIAML